MNIFKGKAVFLWITVLIGMFVMVLGVRGIYRGTVISIFYLYSLTVVDVVLLGLILPGISLAVVREVDSWMAAGRLLALNSRLIWWKKLSLRLLGNCLFFTAVIILPTFTAANVFMGGVKTFGEWLYMLFLFLSYSIYFYLSSLCILILEVRFHQSLLAVSFVLLGSLLPNVFAFFFRQSGIPTVSGLLNLSYALDGDSFYWYPCEKVCVFLSVMSIMVEKTGEGLIKKQDIYW